MTNKKELKKLAGSSVMESEYSDSAKKQLFNFILNEASDIQLKALILNGDIEQLDEDAKLFVDKRFNLSLIESEEQIKEKFNDFINVAKEELCDTIREEYSDIETYGQMINFIVNEASDYQVMSMFFEGNLPDETSNPEKETSLNEMAQNVMNGENLNEIILMTGAAVAAGIIYTSYRLFKRLMTKRGRACAGAVDRKKCYIQFKANLIRKQIQLIKSNFGKCSKTKNPEKCKTKLQNKINKLNARLAGSGEEKREENR